MRNALMAMVFSTVALIASMIIDDMLVSLLSIAASVLRLARAYDVSRRYAVPTVRHLYPYRLRILR